MAVVAGTMSTTFPPKKNIMNLVPLIVFLGGFVLSPMMANAYSVENCVVTVGEDDTDPNGWGYTHVLWLGSSATDINTLGASVDGCMTWTIAGGGLAVYDADDVVDLAPLRHLTAVLGADSWGYSLLIGDNDELASLAGLGHLRGALPGALAVVGNSKLTDLDPLAGLEGVGTANDGKSVYIRLNAALASVRGLGGIHGALDGALLMLDNYALGSLAGLERVTGASSLTILGNAVMCLSRGDRERLGEVASLENVQGESLEWRWSGSECAACPTDVACDRNRDTTAHCFSVAGSVWGACPATPLGYDACWVCDSAPNNKRCLTPEDAAGDLTRNPDDGACLPWGGTGGTGGGG
jgi:hypothetical protein